MRQTYVVELPFRGSWHVFWGGDAEKLNYHYSSASQKYAIDFVLMDGKNPTQSFRGAGKKNADYFAFDQPIYTPMSGVVVEAVSTLRDNRPGETNPFAPMGNFVMIRHVEDVYSVLCHFVQDSLQVKSGDRIKVGQLLGRCGNSGMSTQPHIHFHLQTSDVFFRYDREFHTKPVAKGIKPYFSDIVLERAGKKVSKSYYSPIKGDVVSNRIKNT
jgi:murein DD-endopeptidase MepM/ murein hydrolase activator NlpD